MRLTAKVVNWRITMEDYKRDLRMQLIILESKQAQVLEIAKELEKQIGLLEDALSWDDGGEGNDSNHQNGVLAH